MNLSAGLEGLAGGLQAVGQDEGRAEDREIAQLRQENLLRLQNSFAVQRDNATADRQEKHDDRMLQHQDQRDTDLSNMSADREAAHDKRTAASMAATADRQARTIDAANQRQDDRLTTQMEIQARGADARDGRSTQAEADKADKELADASAKAVAYYDKQMKSQLLPTDDAADAGLTKAQKMARYAKTDDTMLSYYQQMQAAQQKKRAALSSLQDNPNPRSFARTNGGSSADTPPAGSVFAPQPQPAAFNQMSLSGAQRNPLIPMGQDNPLLDDSGE